MNISHHNPNFDASPTPIPLAVGDRFYAQDIFRNFRYLQEYIGEINKRIYNQNKIIIDGLIVTQGAGHTINISSGKAIVDYNVRHESGSWALPSSSTTSDISMLVEVPGAITNYNISSAITDGVTTNYVKLAYKETDGQTRTRAKKAGSYPFEIIPDYIVTVDNIAPTQYEVKLSEFTTDGVTISFTVPGDRSDNSLNYNDNFISFARVGIRTGNPGAGLHIKGDGSSNSFIYLDTDAVDQDIGIRFYEGGGLKYHLFHDASEDVLSMFPDGATSGGIHIKPNGYVGVGSSSPLSGLYLKGTGFPGSFLYLDTAAIDQDVGIRFYEGGGLKYHLFHDASEDVLSMFPDGATSGGTHIKANGYVGVGEISPSLQLHVKGADAGVQPTWSTTDDALLVENSNNTTVQLFSSASKGGVIGFSRPGLRNAGTIEYDHNNNTMVFKTSGSERLRITSEGRIVTGNPTSTSGLTGSMTLHTIGSGGAFSRVENSLWAHGMTGLSPTDTVMNFSPFGGIPSISFYGSNGSNRGLEATFLAQVENTSNIGGYGPLTISGQVKSGTLATSVGNTANVFSIYNYVSAKFHVKGNGDIYTDTGVISSYDDENDIMLVEAARNILSKNKDHFKNNAYIKKYAERLNRLGIIKEGFVSHHKMMQLNLGAQGQLYNMLKGLAKKIGITSSELLSFAKEY
jgi:hypothetical protein